MAFGKLMTGAVLAVALASGGAAQAAGPYDRNASDRVGAVVSFVSFPVIAKGKTLWTAGELRIPVQAAGAAKGPAVLIVHGSGGVDSRGGAYAQALNAAGIATLEIDLWSVRGVTNPSERPRAVADTLPDAFAALGYLAGRREIDPRRIGVMGFSWGGVVSMLSATKAANAALNTSGASFAAHAPLYPVCWAYNHAPGYGFGDLTGAPVLLQSGQGDLYDDPDSCAKLHASLSDADKRLVEVRSYPNATHAWDRREPDMTANDPTSHKGAGGAVPFHYDPAVTKTSTEAVVAFFRKSLAAKP
ncbi:hypothetical protein BH09PSE2_BH09PSE2_12880 [soil metagenome]